jgi:N-acetylneuraminic acid mutarotase
MLIFGRALKKPSAPWSVDVAAAYNPATNTWRRLAPPPGPTGNYEGRYSAVWTGKEMLIWGPLDDLAFNPATNHWRRLPANAAPPPGIGRGIVVWTGREMIGWGGGCCGDAFSEGWAYNPATNTRRKLARSPLAPAQRPIGAWTGRELIILVSGIDPDGKPYPASFARAAAYNPTTDTWRRIAPLPAPRPDATVVWDGHEVLVVGPSRASFASSPATNRWRRLAPMSSGRQRAAAVWTGKRLLIWGGTTTLGGSPQSPPSGLAYDPATNHWSGLPKAPLHGRLDPTAVWTGHAMIVWGGYRPDLAWAHRGLADGAAFRPVTR